MNKKIVDIVTKSIIKSIEDGVPAWRKSWANADLRNYVTGYEYKGINRLILGCLDYKDPRYLTLRQANGLGGKIKKGEKGITVVFWKILKFTDDDDKTKKATKKQEEENEVVIPLLRYYTVFNIEQTEGIDVKPLPENPGAGLTSLECAENIIAKYLKDNPALTFEVKQSTSAYYSRSEDKIVIPRMEQYTENGNYYATAFHEMGHSTGHSSRLNRFTGSGFGEDNNYGKEELVAELTSAFLCNKCKINNTTKMTASYLKNWLDKIKADPSMLITSASKAEKAYDFILKGKPVEIAGEAIKQPVEAIPA